MWRLHHILALASGAFFLIGMASVWLYGYAEANGLWYALPAKVQAMFSGIAFPFLGLLAIACSIHHDQE